MPLVVIKDNESFDKALRTFKRSCEKAGIMSRMRALEFHEKPTAMRKRKRAAAVKRYHKRLAKEREAMQRNRPRRFVKSKKSTAEQTPEEEQS